MSLKKNDELRSALKKLNVSSPLRLSKNGPSFTPPEAARKGVEVPRNEAPHSGPTQSGAAQNEPPQNKSTQIEGPQIEPPHIDVPQNEQTKRRKPAENSVNCEPNHFEAAHHEVTQNEPPHIEVAQSEYTQNEAPRFNQARIEAPHAEVAQIEATQVKLAQNEVPRFEGPKHQKPRASAPAIGTTNGGSFFKLSDRAFFSPELQRVSGDCFRLFIWMSSKAWRYVKSDGTLRASIGYIGEGTAMSHATISRCIRTLREEGLIALLETDYKRGNIWQISPVAFAGSGPGDQPPRFELPQNESAQIEVEAASKRGASSLNLRGKPPQNEGEIRSIKKTLESSQEATALFARIEKIRAAEKQKSERNCLLQLLQTYSPAELERAVAFVERNGVLGGREPCHSPFRYLISAADDVLKIANRGQSSAGRFDVPNEPDPVKSKELSRIAFAAFEEMLSSEEREQFINKFIEQEFTWGYVPARPLLVQLAANSWYEQNQNALEGRNRVKAN